MLAWICRTTWASFSGALNAGHPRHTGHHHRHRHYRTWRLITTCALVGVSAGGLGVAAWKQFSYGYPYIRGGQGLITSPFQSERVTQVPEPGSIVMLITAVIITLLLLARTRFKRTS